MNMDTRTLLLGLSILLAQNDSIFAVKFPTVDLVLVLDISSMSHAEFDVYINSVRSLIKAVQGDGYDNRVAVVYFSNQSYVLTHLSDTSTLSSTLDSLDAIPGPSDGRNTDLALASISEEIFAAKSGDREDIINVVFLVTTGSSFNPHQTLTEANIVKNSNIVLFVIGIGQWVSDEEIQFLSSKPASFYSKRVQSVSYLNGTLEEMAQKLLHLDDEPRQMECAPLFDVAFIIDASSGVSANEFKYQKKFVDQFVSSFDISPNTTRAALIAFNSNSRIVFNLETYTSYTPLSTAIMTVSQTGAGRVLDKAIRFTRNAIFKKVRYDDDLIPVPQILIIITGGKTRFAKKTIREARLLKEIGVTIFTIGVGRRQRYEMSKIASNPVTRFNFNIRRFKAIDKLMEDMINTTCRELGRVTQTTLEEHFGYGVSLPHEECRGESDILFLFQIPPDDEDLKAVCSYMKTVVKYLDVGPDTIRVGLVSYNNRFISSLPLDEDADKKTILAAINNIAGNKPAYNETNENSTKFSHIAHWREEVVKILIFVYTDNPNDGQNSRIDEFNNASHRQDVMRFVINLGNPHPELAYSLASEPKTSHIFYAPFLNNLINSVPYIVERICDESMPAKHRITL